MKKAEKAHISFRFGHWYLRLFGKVVAFEKTIPLLIRHIRDVESQR